MILGYSRDVMKSCTMLHHIHMVHKLALEIERDYSILHSCIQLQCFRNVELELARVILCYTGLYNGQVSLLGYFGGFWAVLWDCALTSPGGHAPTPLKQVWHVRLEGRRARLKSQREKDPPMTGRQDTLQAEQNRLLYTKNIPKSLIIVDWTELPERHQ